jgi:hypothetical protein
MQRRLGSLVVCAVLYLMQSSMARACSCTGMEPRLIADYNATPTVFVGTVTSLQTTVVSGGPRDSSEILVAHLNVDETFKGTDAKDIAVMTDANHSGGCGFGFEVGKQYLVFAGPPWGGAELDLGIRPVRGVSIPIPMRAPTLETSTCSRSALLSYQRGSVTMLRKYLHGMPQPQIEGFVGVHGHQLGFRGLRDITVIARANGRSFETRTDDIGSFLFENLPLGKYLVTARLPAPYPPAVQEAEIQSNEESTSVRLYAKPTAQLRGRLLDFAGRPLATSVAVSLVPLAAASTAQSSDSFTRIFQGGRFDFGEVPPGKYALAVSPFIPTPNAPYPRTFYPHGDSADAAEIFEVKLDVIDNLVFQLPPQLEIGPIAGVAIMADGSPVSKAQVLLYDVEMPSRLAANIRYTDRAGRFRLFGLTGRSYLLQVRKFDANSGSRGIQSQRIAVTVGETTPAVRLLVNEAATMSLELL